MIILAAWCLVAAHPGFVFKRGERTPAEMVDEGIGKSKIESSSGEMAEGGARV